MKTLIINKSSYASPAQLSLSITTPKRQIVSPTEYENQLMMTLLYLRYYPLAFDFGVSVATVNATTWVEDALRVSELFEFRLFESSKCLCCY